MKRKKGTLWCDGGGGLEIGKEKYLIKGRIPIQTSLTNADECLLEHYSKREIVPLKVSLCDAWAS